MGAGGSVMISTPTTAAFLVDIGRAWGLAWMRTLAAEIRDGNIAELDGEACMTRGEVKDEARYEQGALL